MTRCPHCQGSRWIIVGHANVCSQCRRAFEPRTTADASRPAGPAASTAPASSTERQSDTGLVAQSGQRVAARRHQEDSAIELAEGALARCTYLGDCLELPAGAETLHMLGRADADGALTWFDGREQEAFGVNWTDLVGLDVRATDSPGEEITAGRSALLGAVGWVARKRRREAVLCVRATWGGARLLVHGQTPPQLNDALTPLRACIGRTPGAQPTNPGTGIDLE